MKSSIYVRRKVRKKRSVLRKHGLLMLSLTAVGLLFLTVALAGRIQTAIRSPLPPDPIGEASSGPVGHFQAARYDRVVYPYSVIPGGVRSRFELASRMAGDRVVAAHFADFRIGAARMVRAPETRMMHVSYRRDDQVYWTANKVRIPEGEALLTDGECEVRARCGNRVSAAPQLPVSDEEPLLESFDFPELARLAPPAAGPGTGLDLSPLPETGLALVPFDPLDSFVAAQRPSILPYYHRPLFVVRPSDVVVPETGTLALLLTGLAALFVLRCRGGK
jgi:hypothetical protein